MRNGWVFALFLSTVALATDYAIIGSRWLLSATIVLGVMTILEQIGEK